MIIIQLFFALQSLRRVCVLCIPMLCMRRSPIEMSNQDIATVLKTYCTRREKKWSIRRWNFYKKCNSIKGPFVDNSNDRKRVIVSLEIEIVISHSHYSLQRMFLQHREYPLQYRQHGSWEYLQKQQKQSSSQSDSRITNRVEMNVIFSTVLLLTIISISYC